MIDYNIKMVVNCRACGRFLSQTDGVTCIKCSTAFHRKCVSVTDSMPFLPSRFCPHCKDVKESGSTSGDAGPSSQERQEAGEGLAEDQQGPMNSTALNVTEEFNLDLVMEIRHFRLDMQAMREEIRDMRGEIREFHDDVSFLKAAMANNSAQIESMCARIDALETKAATYESPSYIAELENAIVELKLEINDRDQDMLSNDLELTNIPEEPNESPIHIVKLVATKLGVSLEDRDIVSAERVGARRGTAVGVAVVPGVSDGSNASGAADMSSGLGGAGAGDVSSGSGGAGVGDVSSGSGGAAAAGSTVTVRPRALVVRLARRGVRDDLLRGARARRGADTADFGFKSNARVFYVNERLSKTNRRLFYLAREAGRLHKWRFVWTKEGRVYARREPEQAAHRIRTEEDITRVFGSGIVSSS